jgi:endoglycosylceramidase
MSAPPRLRCSGGALRDEHDRVCLLRGVNVSGRSKSPPFLPFDEPSALDRLADWGMNAIRLLVIWEAIEPTRGRIDRDYIARVRAIVAAAGERGLAVIIDFHQDLFARELGGDGAPAWAIARSGRAARGRSWFWHYGLSTAVQGSFDAFWSDREGIRTCFLACVREVMLALQDEPAVVGYDLFNEPMAGLRAVASGRFEREQLADFHRTCVQLRDQHAPGRLLLIEPTPLVAFAAPTALGAIAGEDLVYAPHLYDATAIMASRWLPRASTFPRALAGVQRTATTRGWPLLIGEFGILGGTIDDARMMEDQCSRLDRVFASWTAWHYNPSDVDWNDEDASIVDAKGGERPWTGALVRPYPRALAGTPRAWESAAERPWTLEYDAIGEAPTEIVVPPRWRGDASPTARIDGGSSRWSDDARVLSVAAQPGARVRVVLPR